MNKPNKKSNSYYFLSESQRKKYSKLNIIYSSKQNLAIFTCLVLLSGIIALVLVQQSRQSNAAVVPIVSTATADTYVTKPLPTRTLSTEKDMWVRGGTTNTSLSYIRFEVKGIGTKTISSAKLRLYHLDNSSPSGGQAYRINWDWGYNPTWSRHPGIPAGTPKLGELGLVNKANTYYDMNLSTSGWKDGFVTIVLKSNVDDGLNYSTGQGGKPAQLILTPGETSSPAPAPAPSPNPAPVVGRPYDPLAIFNQPIPANHPTDSRSSTIMPRFVSNTSGTGVFFAIGGETPPLYKSNNSSPLYSVSAGGVNQSFRVPTNARGGGGTDNPLIVLNTDTNQELRIWRVNIDHTNRRITGQNGSLFYYNGDGRILNPNGTRSISIPYVGSGAGNGLSYHGGMITRADWDAGVIRHALRVAYNNCSFNGNTYRLPAIRSDQPNGCTSAGSSAGMDMGMILQLSKSIDCNTRTAASGRANDTKLVRMVCKAMQDYGVMISDGTGAGIMFYMENDYTAGWSSLLTVQNGHLGWMFRNPSGTNAIPWNQFRVVAKPSSNISW